MVKRSIILLALFVGILSTHIELPLYEVNNHLKPEEELDIDLIDGANIMTNITLGTPFQSIPFQVEMLQKDICVVNEKYEEKVTTPMLGNAISSTYQRIDTLVQTDKIKIQEKSFDLEMQDYGEVYGKGELNDFSSGILGLSLDSDWLNPEQTKDRKFMTQLKSNNLISNNVFYFDINKEKSQSPVPTFDELFGKMSGKLVIGDYPYNVNSNICHKEKVKKSPIQQVVTSKELVMHDETSSSILFDMSKCIGCTSCVRNCQKTAGQGIFKAVQIDPENPKKKLVQIASGKTMAETSCIGCGQCTLGCPKGALREVDSIEEVTKELTQKKKVVVCQIAPAIRVNMAEALGVAPGTVSLGKVVTALKKLGFDYVFDTNYGADMTIVEEATELLDRINDPDSVLPMFTSCCPAWINYVEKVQPEMIPHLSSCKSPLSMVSAIVREIFSKKIGVAKDQIYNVAIMPCTAKKEEIVRPQVQGDTDAVITSRELAKMIKEAKIDFKNLEESKMESIFEESTGAGDIFCATGGVMEAAVRAAYKFTTGKDMTPINLLPVRGTEGIKKASVDINGKTVNVAVVHGTSNAMEILRKIKAKEEGFADIHFIEVMACPGGCVVGGGSPRPKGKKGVEARLNATYSIDENKTKRTSQDNEQMNKMYEESLGGEYGSHEAHELLHTYYTNRQVDKVWSFNLKHVSLNHTAVSSFSSKAIVRVEHNFLVAPKEFEHILEMEFLNLPHIHDICSIHWSPSMKYNYIACKTDNFDDIKSFPKLELYSDEFDHNFVFTAEDLFFSHKGYYVLLIIIDMNKDHTWELGLPFLRKNTLFFDMENEEIGFCEEEHTMLLSGMNLVYIVLAAVIVENIALGYMCRKKDKKERKKRAHELIEDHEYVSEKEEESA